MARGRKPTPLSLKILRGDVAQVPAQPKPDVDGPVPGVPSTAGPECPAWLDDTARAEWARVAREVDLERTDRAILTLYCQTYSQWERATRQIASDGQTFTTVSGAVRKHPAVSIASDCAKAMKPMLELLGLTRRDRGEASTDDEIDQFNAAEDLASLQLAQSVEGNAGVGPNPV